MFNVLLFSYGIFFILRRLSPSDLYKHNGSAHQMPHELTAVWNDAMKMREYLQKLRQSLVAAGASVNISAVDAMPADSILSESVVMVSDADSSGDSKEEVLAVMAAPVDLDLYDSICDKILKKTKFLLLEVFCVLKLI